jgi:hypothetical protein
METLIFVDQIIGLMALFLVAAFGLMAAAMILERRSENWRLDEDREARLRQCDEP